MDTTRAQELEALWARLDALPEEEFVARMDELAAALPPAIADFERACALDSTGHSDRAVPLYRRALEAGLTGVRRRRATIQLASSLRNLGRSEESVALLRAERDAGSDELDDAVDAFLALALADVGRPTEGLSLALRALAPHLPRYQRSSAAYAAELPGGRTPRIAPQLAVGDGQAALRFYAAAFGAQIDHQVGGTPANPSVVAQLSIGETATFWVADEAPDHGTISPERAGAVTAKLLLLVDDPHAAVARALEAGATQVHPVQDEHGWRMGRVRDPFGHDWEIGRRSAPGRPGIPRKSARERRRTASSGAPQGDRPDSVI
jgi:uncharacterized glyoxalase superfamily protein PhnB